ncbi:M20/M25/M40 family metallo-hydrolase [Hufsiella ginkgonis]|uniref:M20/M25/M40 family metallo-hydrolase n=1 Tax=Hufsiella ginkgonis TaxID=2695274 RepID=A0A7K1XWB2_9SPHI|nr:M20/M25/M40 family metallo-hydrolase [Hufsiella ginkgonis]MXV15275.1 M20/M25/M40 family metallo-hydrolase [Hufsiella ginkgonis]
MRYQTRCFMAPVILALALQTSKAQTSPESSKYESEMAKLAAQPVIKKALRVILELEPATLKDHILLTEIPAPPFKEKQRGEKFYQLLKAIGFDSVWTDRTGNVLALRKGKNGKRTVVLEGHLDTVFPEGTDVTVKHAGDTLKAPGIGDDTRGLAVVLAIAKAMREANIKTEANLLFIGSVGEEGLGDLRGVKGLFGDGAPKIDSYIAIDGGGIGGIVYGGVGSMRYRVTIKGPGGHSYGAFGLANPHHALARAIGNFIREADPYTRTGTKTTYNVGVIGGGTSVNAIPYESWMEVDMRSESPEKLAGIGELFKEAIQKGLDEENSLLRSGPKLTADIRLVGERPVAVQEQNIPLVRRAMASAGFLGARPVLSFSSTNANIPISKKVPAVTIGKGGVGGNTHSLDEWWINEKGYLGIQNALLILVAEAGLAK